MSRTACSCRHLSSWCGERPVILETIVTTVADDGTVNFAPMGVEWGDAAIILKPFIETATYRNVLATGAFISHRDQ